MNKEGCSGINIIFSIEINTVHQEFNSTNISCFWQGMSQWRLKGKPFSKIYKRQLKKLFKERMIVICDN
jgi:hypothetical protein